MMIAAACILPGLSRAATVSGHVTDHLTGLALSNIQLTIWYPTQFSGEIIGSPTTAADGSYSWSGECPVQDRDCNISISDEHYLYAISHFQYDDTEVTADFVLVRAATIAGEVRIDGAIPTSAVDVAISYHSEIDQSWVFLGGIQQTENGHYTLDQLPPGVPYRVCAGGLQTGNAVAIEQCFDHHDQTSLSEDPSYDFVTVGEGEQRDDIDFDLSSGGGIEGTLHDGTLGVPLAYTYFSMFFYDETGASLLAYAVGFSDANGRYRFDGLPDGAYYVRADISGAFVDASQIYPGIVCENAECPPATDGQQLTVADGSLITAIDFIVHPIAIIRGRVTDAATGQGLGGVFVAAGSFAATITAADTGEFALYVEAQLPPFEVFASFVPLYIDQVYPGIACIQYPSCSEVGEVFSPALGEVVEHVDFALQPGAAITGTLYDAVTGLPQRGQINIYDQDFNIVWSRLSFPDGSYESPPWFPGTYYVQAIAYPESSGAGGCAFYEARPCPLEGQDPADVMPTPITIGVGEIRSDIDFQLNADGIFRSGFEQTAPFKPAVRAGDR